MMAGVADIERQAALDVLFLCGITGFTEAMYEGNEPAGKGHELISGGYADRWQTRYGGGESHDGIIDHCSFSFNQKVTLHIVGDWLWIVDQRHSGKPDFWEYTNIEGRGMPGPPCCSERSRHTLEPERIEKLLNSRFDNEFWRMVQRRAKELYVER